jgi:hypothetical protein
VETVDVVGHVVFDDPALCMLANQLDGRSLQLISQQERRSFMSKVGDGQLKNQALVSRHLPLLSGCSGSASGYSRIAQTHRECLNA